MTITRKTLYLAVISVFVLFSQNSRAQTNTLYFMEEVHQSTYLNPAYQSSCNAFLGLPALSNINFDIAHNGFSYKNLIHLGTGNRSDSLILDIENIKSKLGKSNYLLVGTTVPVLGLGFWINNSYFTFDISNKTKARVSYPDNLIKVIDGNGDYIGADNPLEISDFGPDIINYHELAFGLSRKITHRLFIGARFKILSGVAALESKKSDIKLYTEEKYYALHLESNFDYNISAPITISTDSVNQFDEVVYDDSNTLSNIFSAKNIGIALDLGATYQFNDKLKLYGSITDLGFIRWKENALNLRANGAFDFSGLSLDSIASDSDYDEFDDISDSIMKLSEITKSNNNFSTYLNTNIYLGASYDIGDFMKFGFLSRTSFYDRKAHQAFTLSANLRPVKWFSGTLSYSIDNRSYNNLGLGLVFGRRFQFYLLTDNLNAAFNVKGTRAVGLQLGLNLNFGCNKRDDYSIINNKKLKKDIDFM